MRRLLRALATLGVCSEGDDGRYRLSALGALLCEDHPQSLRAWALLTGGVIWQRWSELDQSVRSSISHRRRHGGDDPFGHLERDPEAAAVFNRAMVELTRLVAQEVARAVDFSRRRAHRRRWRRLR